MARWRCELALLSNQRILLLLERCVVVPPMFGRLAHFVVPSLVGVCLAALLSAFAETMVHTSSVVDSFAGAGYTLLFLMPAGLVLSLFGRLLFKSWKWDELMASMRTSSTEVETKSVPRFAAWVVFLFLSAVVFISVAFQGMRLLFSLTRLRGLVMLAAPWLMLGIVVGLLLVSKPVLQVLERLFRAVDTKREVAGRSPFFSAKRILLWVVTLVLIIVVITWRYMVQPKIGHIELGFLYTLVFFVLGLVFLPWLWNRLALRKPFSWLVSGCILATLVLCVVLSVWARSARPYRMLEIWGDTKIAGWAIDTLYDVQSMRVDLKIEGIEPKELPGAPHPNIVVVTIDTLRADHISFYGGKVEMPALSALSKSSVVFERAFSPGNVTRRSLPTLATGLSPHRVRGRVAGWALRMDPRHILLAERFRAGGYDTAGFFCCRSHFGRDHKLGLVRGIDHLELENDGAALAQNAVRWLEQRKEQERPLFLWTHFIEPHNWEQDYKSKKGSRNKKDRYNLSLIATDSALAILLEGVRKSLGPQTIIVVTSDHGEGLGDHGMPHHSGGLYNSEIRVPLLISIPGVKPFRLQQAVGLVDLAPTLLELAGFVATAMPQMDGLSVAPVLLGKEKNDFGVGEAYSVMVADRSVKESQSAIISGRFKIIEYGNGDIKLYDLSLDPKEKKDIQKQSPVLTESMKARLKRRKKIDKISPF